MAQRGTWLSVLMPLHRNISADQGQGRRGANGEAGGAQAQQLPSCPSGGLRPLVLKLTGITVTCLVSTPQIKVAAESNKVALSRILETSEERCGPESFRQKLPTAQPRDNPSVLPVLIVDHRKYWTQVMVHKEEETHDDRVAAILELKANTDKVRTYTEA